MQVIYSELLLLVYLFNAITPQILVLGKREWRVGDKV